MAVRAPRLEQLLGIGLFLAKSLEDYTIVQGRRTTIYDL